VPEQLPDVLQISKHRSWLVPNVVVVMGEKASHVALETVQDRKLNFEKLVDSLQQLFRVEDLFIAAKLSFLPAKRGGGFRYLVLHEHLELYFCLINATLHNFNQDMMHLGNSALHLHLLLIHHEARHPVK